jgi:thiol:disulfide interchange protein DsbD
MKKIYAFSLLILFSTSFNAQALDQEELLDVDDAFAPTITEVNSDNIKLHFDIADKYYLYKHAFKFPNEDSQVLFGEAKIPNGHKKEDEFFGEVETYHKGVDIVIPYENKNGVKAASFKFRYQGCAEAGVCYPPQTKTVQLNLPVEQDSILHDANPLNDNISDSLGLNDDWGGQIDSVLPEDQAFKAESIAMDANHLSTRFTMSPHVYLYQDKVKLTSLTDGISIGALKFPTAEKKEDPHFGTVNIFYDQVEVDVAISRATGSGNQLELEAEFQGCVNEGICYPPSTRIIKVELPPIQAAETVTKVADTAVSEQGDIQDQLGNSAWWKIVLKFFVIGLGLALTPCVFPMIPILSGLIAGQKNITTSKALTLSIIYVLSMALAYTIAGVIAGMLGANIQAALQTPVVIVSFSIVFVLLSLSMFGYYDLQLPASWQAKLMNVSNKQEGGSHVGVAIMGFLSAIIVGPCVTPALAGTVIYISEAGDPVIGGLALFAMSIGMGVPLLIIGATEGKWMPKAGGWMNVIKSFFGIALLAMAIWFLSRIIPGRVTLLLFGILALLSSVFWFRYAQKNIPKGSKLIWLFLAFKIALIGVGAVEIMGAIRGNTDFMHPLSKYETHFTTIKSYEDLQQAIKKTDKIVLLDFYADWCIECKRMEGATYSKPKVQAALERFLVLKADVTAQDEIDKELMKKFKIVGPPATLFFGRDGQLIGQSSFFGFKNENEFVAHLQAIAGQ